MTQTNNKSEKLNIADNEKTARSKFIIFSIFLVLFMFGSIVDASTSHRIFSEEIKLINQQSYGSLSIIIWLPFFLFSATIMVLGFYLDYITQYKKEKNTQKSVFREMLKELRKPTNKKTKKRTLIFWILLIISILVFVGSQLFLFLGIAFLI